MTTTTNRPIHFRFASVRLSRAGKDILAARQKGSRVLSVARPLSSKLIRETPAGMLLLKFLSREIEREE